jgi:hypothetical protein
MAPHPPQALLDGPLSLERTRALRHVADCDDCRAQWAGEDPSRLFGLLAALPVPAGDLDRLSARLDAALAANPRATARRTGGGHHARSAGLALAAALALASAIGLYLGLREVPDAPVSPALVEFQGAGAPAAAEVRVLSPRAAEVITLQAGDTQVVMIFDEALDL